MLKIYLLRSGQTQELQGSVAGITGNVVNVDASGEETALDLGGAEFNGDMRSPRNSPHDVYLVCEYPNGDRFSFYAPRAPRAETGGTSAERRDFTRDS